MISTEVIQSTLVEGWLTGVLANVDSALRPSRLSPESAEIRSYKPNPASRRMGRTIRMKKSPSHTHNFTFSLRISHSWRFRTGDTYLRLAFDPLPYLTEVLPHHYISMPYGPNLTNKFAIPHVCLNHVYVPAVHSCPNELYNNSWRYARYDQSNRATRTRAVSVECLSESITYHTNYITYPPVPSVQNVLLGSLNNPKKFHLGIKAPNQPFLNAFSDYYEKWHTRRPEKP